MNLEPVYIKKTPTKDGWNNPLQYECADGSEYTIQSYAKGGGNEGLLNGTGGPTSSFSDDIFFSNGGFVQWPEGQQR